ncbi:MAG: threonine/serine dehydratase [Pseudomonadota bacterium]
MDASDLSLKHIREAAQRLQGVAIETPLLRHDGLDAQCQARVLIKPECLQRTGSFKIRGAYNRLAALTAPERTAGVVAWSSGNHAQGIAAAASLLGISATIVMPADAPAIKLERTRALGARVVLYDRYRESREDIASDLSRKHGAILVPSYDDPYIIAGQGTVGLELATQASALGHTLDRVFVCCGGGGLTAGIALAFEALSPATHIHTVEPAGLDDHARSLETGTLTRNAPGAHSICDALLAPQPGDLTFRINRGRLSQGLAVNDDEVRAAMRFAFEELKLVVEPGGAVALAAALQQKLNLTGETVALILSGGNVTAAFLAEQLAAAR